jgi:hypothetical protein
MSAPWPLRAAATAVPALLVLAAATLTGDTIRIEPGRLAWRALVRGPAPDGTLRAGAAILLPGLSRDRARALFVEAIPVDPGPAGLAIGVDAGPLERARLEGGGIAARIPASGTRGARLELRAQGAPVRMGAVEVGAGALRWARLLPALLVPPVLVLALRRRADARLALSLGFVTAALLLVAAMPVLDALVPVRAVAWLGPALAAVTVALALRPDRRGLVRGSVLAAAFVLGAWVRVVFLPSAGSWDTEYWKAWTARADAHGVARVYGDTDAVPAGHFVAQLRGREPLWLVPYRGRDFVVDYPPLAMAAWRSSWRTVASAVPRLDHGEAENAAVKLPAVLGDVAAVALLLVLFRATPSRAATLAAAYWALPVSWLSSGVLGFLDGALAFVVVVALVAAGRGRAVLAGVALGLAGLIKPTALVVAPAVWCALVARRASPWRAVAAGAATVAAALVPFVVAGTLPTAIVHVYRILFQGTLSGGFPNPWWLLGHALTVAHDGAPFAGPVRFAKLDLLPIAARPVGTLLFAVSAVLVWRAQRNRTGAPAACLAGALLVLAYGVCAVGVHENHPHALFLCLFATGLATRGVRLLTIGCAFVYVANMLMLSGLGRFYGPRYAILEPFARWVSGLRMALGFDLTLVLAVLQIALFAWFLARLPIEMRGVGEDGS